MPQRRLDRHRGRPAGSSDSACPRRAELAYYLQGGRAKLGWGMIACWTVENCYVDGRVQFGESSSGSSLSRVLR